MLSNDLTQILLLNPVKINYDLTKWNPDGKKDASWGADALGSLSMNTGSSFFPVDANIWDGVPFATRREFRSPVMRGVAEAYIRFRMLFTKPKKDPVKFFMEVKDNFEELEKVEVTDKQLEPMLKKLESSKQKYAISSLVSSKKMKKMENTLVTHGFVRYQTEESMIKFIKQCKKGLCLTEIEYFDKVIPEDVMAKFEKAEETKMFDNYLIMYHDPKNAKNIYYTSDVKKKDPIMFGVIRGSNKMYFIADWIDDYCNLTYKDILEQGIDMKLKTEKLDKVEK
jgi:hypothetical protein